MDLIGRVDRPIHHSVPPSPPLSLCAIPVVLEEPHRGLALHGGARGGHGRDGAVLLVEGEAVSCSGVRTG